VAGATDLVKLGRAGGQLEALGPPKLEDTMRRTMRGE
jgi:hypothetical protein